MMTSGLYDSDSARCQRIRRLAVCATLHRLHRIASKSLLQDSSYRITETCEQMVRPRVGKDVVPNRIVFCSPLDCESLLSPLGVFGKSSIGEPEPSIFVDHIHYATSVQRPESKMMCEHADGRARFDRRIRPAQPQPAYVEHLPSVDRFNCALEHAVSSAELDAIVIDLVALRWRRPVSGGFIGKGKFALRIQKARDCLVRRSAEQEHSVRKWSFPVRVLQRRLRRECAGRTHRSRARSQ